MENCIFCKIVRGEVNSWKVYEDEHTIALLDINPLSEYHTIVIPKAHYVNALDAPSDVFLHVMNTTKHVIDLYTNKLWLKNLQILHNAGSAAGQEVFHLHVHIIPRNTGDKQIFNWKTHPRMRENFDEMLAQLTRKELYI